VMSLEPEWVSTLFPAYLLIANIYGGIAALAVAPRAPLRDLRLSLVGFALIWIYLIWSQFLVIWYANLPSEAGFVAHRLVGVWPALGAIVLLTRFALPILLLLRRGPLALGAIATITLIGFWIECWMMVGSTIHVAMAPVATVTVTVAFAFAFTASLMLTPRPHAPPAR
jgi:hypothetical protein